MQNIKRRFLASLLGIELMGLPCMTHAFWLGDARANLSAAYPYSGVAGLLPFINHTRYIGWVECNITGGADQKASSRFHVPALGSTDLGAAFRYVWTPELIVGAYFFINTPQGPSFDTVTFKKPFEINPGLEFVWPDTQTSLHINLAWLKQGRERRSLDPYFKGSWKVERKIYNRLMGSVGTYHTKYTEVPGFSDITSGLVMGFSYIWDPNVSVFVKYYHGFQEKDAPVNPIYFGAQWKIGKTAGCNNRVKRYLRQPLDRHIAPIEPFRGYNHARGSYYGRGPNKSDSEYLKEAKQYEVDSDVSDSSDSDSDSDPDPYKGPSHYRATPKNPEIGLRDYEGSTGPTTPRSVSLRRFDAPLLYESPGKLLKVSN